MNPMVNAEFLVIRHPNTRPLQGTYCMAEPWGWMLIINEWRISEDRLEILCACFRNCFCSSPFHPQFYFRSMRRCRTNAWRFIELSSLMLGFFERRHARAEGHRKTWRSAVTAFSPISPCREKFALTSHSAKCSTMSATTCSWYNLMVCTLFSRLWTENMRHLASHFHSKNPTVSRIHGQIPLNAPLDFDRAGLLSLSFILCRRKNPGEGSWPWLPCPGFLGFAEHRHRWCWRNSQAFGGERQRGAWAHVGRWLSEQMPFIHLYPISMCHQ